MQRGLRFERGFLGAMTCCKERTFSGFMPDTQRFGCTWRTLLEISFRRVKRKIESRMRRLNVVYGSLIRRTALAPHIGRQSVCLYRRCWRE